jgi:hypothetical protein
MSPSKQFTTVLERPRCLRCQRRMKLEQVSPGSEGFEERLFECAKCDHTETRVIPSDPIRSRAVGWLAGELRSPE